MKLASASAIKLATIFALICTALATAATAQAAQDQAQRSNGQEETVSVSADEVSLVIEPFDSLFDELVVSSSPNSLASVDLVNGTGYGGTAQGPLFGRGAYLLQYEAQDGGFASVSHILYPAQGTFTCSGATHLSIWYKNVGTQIEAAADTYMRIMLADESECVDENNTYACDTVDDYEYYLHDIKLDAADNDGWQEAKIELPWFATEDQKAWTPYTADDVYVTSPVRGQTGNGVLDAGRIHGWSVQIYSRPLNAANASSSFSPYANATTSSSSGSVLIDHMSCVGNGDLLSSGFHTGASFAQGFASKIWNVYTPSTVAPANQSNFTFYQGGIRMDYVLHRSESWGGILHIDQLLPHNAYFNLSGATHVSFDYEVPKGHTAPGQAHFRLILQDSSEGKDQVEHYYSFHDILDDLTRDSYPEQIEIELRGSSRQGSPFVRTGWSGAEGNDMLDAAHIAYIRYEAVLGSQSDPDSTSTGVFGFRNMKASVRKPISQVKESNIAEPSLVIHGKGQFRKVNYYANQCKNACTYDPKCRYGYIENGDCFFAPSIGADDIHIDDGRNFLHVSDSFWSDKQSSRGDFCDKCQCIAKDRTIDCRGQNLVTLPKTFTAPQGEDWTPEVLDLRNNPMLVMIGSRALADVAETLADIRLPASLGYLSPDAVHGLPKLTAVRFEAEQDEWDGSTNAAFSDASHTHDEPRTVLINAISRKDETFGDICCTPRRQLTLASSATGLSFCEKIDGDTITDAVYAPFQEIADGRLLEKLQLNSPFLREAARSVEKCADFCNLLSNCQYFFFENKITTLTPTCNLLTDSGSGIVSSCCGDDVYADANKTQPGTFVGRPPRTRRLVDNAVVIVGPTLLVANRNNGYEATFDVSLGSSPLRGAVWVEPKLKLPAAYNVSISPQRVVLYDDDTVASVTVRVLGATGSTTSNDDPIELVISNDIQSCDVAFMPSANEEAAAINVRLSVRLPIQDPPKQDNTRAIVAIVASVCSFLLALAVLMAFIIRYRIVDDSVWSVDKSEVKFDDPPVCIGEGSFGRVYLAKYRGTQVAVKCVAYSSTKDGSVVEPQSLPDRNTANHKLETESSPETTIDVSESVLDALPTRRGRRSVTSSVASVGRGRLMFGLFDKQSRLKADFVDEMRHLSKIRHPCIATVMGAVMDKKEGPMLLLEFMDYGSLSALLLNETIFIEPELKMQFLKDIAQGLRFLHAANPAIIHGDLKAANCLIDSNLRCKVTDFGLSQRKGGKSGTPFWMAPELLSGQDNSDKTDVYAFGVTMYEVYARKLPYDEEDDKSMDTAQVLLLVADPSVNKRPLVPKSCPPKIRDMMNACLASDPSFRPPFEMIDEQLQAPNARHAGSRKAKASATEEKKERDARRSHMDTFPDHIAQALRSGKRVEPETKEVATVFFADVEASIARSMSPSKLADLLDRLHSRFDDLAKQHDVFKMHMAVGNAFMAVTNLVKDQSDHAKRMATFASAVVHAAKETLVDTSDPSKGFAEVRAGMHSGQVVASIVGSRNPRYCLLGDAVNVASGIQSTSKPNCVQCTTQTAKLIKSQTIGDAQLHPRDYVNIKGKGKIFTYWVGAKHQHQKDEDDDGGAGGACSAANDGNSVGKEDGSNPVVSLTNRPVAGLFPDASVMFADITNFTSWSSARSPDQVFTLLEQLYSTFDGLASQYGIFKVESVGDSYVAACGLPEARDGHAVDIVQFAMECLTSSTQIFNGLEILLGPDTSDLALRIGINSGPVTGGVLRGGSKSRFQLFGDTVNTASRIESTGRGNAIHISRSVADQLKEAGKDRWVSKRSDRVTAKGVTIDTFWVNVALPADDDSVNTSVDDGASVDTSDRRQVQTASKQNSSFSRPSRRQQRLEEWVVDVLLKQLKLVVAMRNQNATAKRKPMLESSSALTKSARELDPSKTVLDEVKEIIYLPAAAREHKHDPEGIDLGPDVMQQLRKYVRVTACWYRDNSFHCFEHATHVTQSVIKLLGRIVAKDDIDFQNLTYKQTQDKEQMHDHTFGITSDPIVQFACAFSSLIHDAEHTGVPNATLVREKTALAVKYNNKSVAEQNSVDIAWDELMKDDYANLRACIFTTQAELDRFRSLVVNGVMATDIVDKELGAARKARWAKAFHKGAKDEFGNSVPAFVEPHIDAVNRKATIVIEHIIQASDVSHTMQHWHIFIKWNERLFHELYKAHLAGRGSFDPSQGWYKGELGFFDFYIIPLAKKLKECGVFGVSGDEYLNYALANRAEWEAKGHDIVKRYMSKYETDI